jgi:hypothetical protein
MIVTIAAMTLLVSALVWFFGSRELASFHLEVRDYLDKMDKFKDWEAQGGSAD